MKFPLLAIAALSVAATASAQSVTSVQFVNGITISGAMTDLSNGTIFDQRLGMFSDLYYDSNNNDWWGLSDRGPGGGLLPYETRLQRFTIDINMSTGQVSNFQVAQTIKFNSGGSSMNGLAPSPTSVLGNALDPEGIVISPLTGNILVSDEYGPSLLEFDRNGDLVRRFNTPANLIPRDASGTPNYASDLGNIAGKTTNRGFEGLATSPDGKFVYAMMQSGMLDEGAGNGLYSRIVKFDAITGDAVAQYAYKLDAASQGRGTSALVALGNDKFLVLERNNRGVGVGATISPADKAVYEIDLTGATDVSNISITNGVLPAGVQTVAKGAKVMDLDANTLAALGGKSPEKWEGLAIGPRLNNGEYFVLAGTDNDYSVTQNGAGTQFDVYFDFSKSDPYAASIQCPLGQVTGCVFTAGGGAATLTSVYSLLPGVLHAYSMGIDNYVAVVTPEPATAGLMVLGLVFVGVAVRRRRVA
ncbi:MAG: esterase-like activity of phytase family protein [bacterium]